MTAIPLYLDSDQILYLANVKDITGAFLNNGTVTYTIRSKSKIGTDYQIISAGDLSYVSPGRYEKILDITDIQGIEEGVHYYIILVFSNSSGQNLTKRFEVYGAYSE